MELEQVQAWRRLRLKQAAETYGSNVALAKALEYKDGSYVGQMIRGVRPIDEKTVAAIQALPRLAGWFTQPASIKTVAQRIALIYEQLPPAYQAQLYALAELLETTAKIPTTPVRAASAPTPSPAEHR